jgi:hypothetical protein
VRQARTAVDVQGQEIILARRRYFGAGGPQLRNPLQQVRPWDSALSMDHSTVSPMLSAILMFWILSA